MKQRVRTRDGASSRAGSVAADTRAILDSLRRIIRFVRMSAIETTKLLGITTAQLYVLQSVDETPGLSVNELAERTYTDQSSVSVVVQRLVDRGLVQRRRSTSDRRRIEIRLSRTGKTLLQRDQRAPQRGLIRGIASLPPAARKRLDASLRGLLRESGIDQVPATMMFEDEPKRRVKRRS